MKDEDQREYVRVNANCPVRYRVIGTDDSKQMKTDTFDPFSSMEIQEIVSRCNAHQEESDRDMMRLLLWLDWKVTYLFKTLLGEKDQSLFPHQAVLVDLSATGMGLYAPKAEPLGTRLQFKLILPILPFKELILNAEVMRTMQRGEDSQSHAGFEMGVAFKDQKKSDREDLFRYVIKREREIRLSVCSD